MNKELEDILERYAYGMTLYYGKEDKKDEYRKMLNIISNDIQMLREEIPEKYKFEKADYAQLTLLAESFNAEYSGCGSHKIKLVINLSDGDLPSKENKT